MLSPSSHHLGDGKVKLGDVSWSLGSLEQKVCTETCAPLNRHGGLPYHTIHHQAFHPLPIRFIANFHFPPCLSS